jgi:hypothetical protein
MSSPDADAEAQARAARQGELLRSYRAALQELPEGRAVLRDLLVATGLLAVSHVSGDSHETAFAEGRRSIGLHLLERMRWTEMELLALARQRSASTVAAVTEEMGS